MPELVEPHGEASNQPVLFHKIKNERSILALAVSDSRLFAGTQAGEILVSLLRRFEFMHQSNDGSVGVVARDL